VLPPQVTARVSVEQASTFGWERWVGLTGVAIGMRTFGATAPIKDLMQKFGFTVDAVVAAALQQIGRDARSPAKRAGGATTERTSAKPAATAPSAAKKSTARKPAARGRARR
jgi:hypothetical protein